MTKRGSSEPPFSAVRGRHWLISIWRALEGDPKWLASALRHGVASNAEMKVAADLIEGKIKPRHFRSGTADRQRRLEITQWVSVLERICPHAQRKSVIGEVAVAFAVSERHVYDVLAEFKGDDVLEIERSNAAGHALTFDRDTLERIVNSLLARK